MRNTPRFICIGAQKAGTTWLDQQLRKHPQVWMPPIKEVHFFDYIHRPEFRKWILWHLKSTMRRELTKITESKAAIDWENVAYLSSIMRSRGKFTEEWYEYIFSNAPSDKVSGEITPEYSTLNSEAIAHMDKLCKKPVFIYIIRDPVERAWSQLKMNMVRNGDYKKAVGITKRITNIDIFHRNIEHYSITDRANYKEYVPNWDVLEDRILYLPFGDIKAEPNNVLSRVSNFIGVSNDFDFTGADEKVHKGSGLKAPEIVKSHLQEVMKEQYQFLEERFGKTFVNSI